MSNPYAGIAANRRVKAKAEVHSYDDAERFLDGADERDIASNVRIWRLSPDCIGVMLYSTTILRYYADGRWTADNGGWNTPTTSARATQFGPEGVFFYHHKKVLLPKEGFMDRIKRMTGEQEHDRLPIRDSWLRLIGTFTWNPNPAVPNNERHMIRVGSGTCYDARTPTKVIEVIETYMGNTDVRLRFHWGDTETGRDWCDEWSVEGRIGVTTGMIRSPLLCSNARSMGGFPILDTSIVRIRFANRRIGGDLYRHPNYHVDMEQFRAGMPGDEEAARVFVRHFA